MFETVMNFFKKLNKKDNKVAVNSKEAAKERLHLVLMQDRANVSADFLELMKQEIIEVIKKYIDVDEREIDVRLTNKENGDGTNGAPALYANIPILNIKNESRKVETKDKVADKKSEKTNKKQKQAKKVEKVEKVENKKINEVEKTIQAKIEDVKSEESKPEEDKVELNKEMNISEQDKEIDPKEENNETKEEIKSEN